eukprot:CAMPEP_0204870260 /NCGR_PEP_ID=MMETSP1348-20121228/31959_1 /ASSEMBLY_ACC=CAM_ASM_000700 /TAXON_ID=215587 /ORGANISM="Aplanochytrium stocchinoi, Strain GSBS06" /LENGTH=122 /DNA_ID=CAMNT_0052023977 /DNA_START=209 /DNA_END=577 /DNA_ORIENTATION=+
MFKFEETKVESSISGLKLKSAETKNLNLLKSTFRGRELDGVKLPLPAGVKGYVFHVNDADGNQDENEVENGNCTEDQETKMQVDAIFDSIHHWNHDRLPNQRDDIQNWLAWTAAARCLHEPI